MTRACSSLFFGALLVSVALFACDALVGGECRPGLVVQDGACVPDVNSSGGGGQGAGGGSGAASSNSVGGSGGSMCDPPKVACPEGCADLQTDISNCGECGNYCLSEICVDGMCVGQTVGHVVVVGMNYGQVNQPMRTLFGNAMFLMPENPLRVLEWRQFADPNALKVVDAVLVQQAALRGRSVNRTPVEQDQLVNVLLSTPKDVLLVHDQASTTAGDLPVWGTEMKDAIKQFTGVGGTVVVLATNAGAGEMGTWLANTELLTVNSMSVMTGEQVANNAPGDAVGLSVLAPFLARPLTVSFDITVDPQHPVATVLSRKTDGEPVAIHRVVFPDP